jgi:hypothetical protein
MSYTNQLVTWKCSPSFLHSLLRIFNIMRDTGETNTNMYILVSRITRRFTSFIAGIRRSWTLRSHQCNTVSKTTQYINECLFHKAGVPCILLRRKSIFGLPEQLYCKAFTTMAVHEQRVNATAFQIHTRHKCACYVVERLEPSCPRGHPCSHNEICLRMWFQTPMYARYRSHRACEWSHRELELVIWIKVVYSYHFHITLNQKAT